MKPICVSCHRFYRPKHNGYFFIEGMPTEVPACGTMDRHTAVPGLAEAKFWKPYKLWSGDLWECQGCGHQIISGVGKEPIAEHYQPDFADNMKAYDARIQINDC